MFRKMTENEIYILIMRVYAEDMKAYRRLVHEFKKNQNLRINNILTLRTLAAVGYLREKKKLPNSIPRETITENMKKWLFNIKLWTECIDVCDTVERETLTKALTDTIVDTREYYNYLDVFQWLDKIHTTDPFTMDMKINILKSLVISAENKAERNYQKFMDALPEVDDL